MRYGSVCSGIEAASCAWAPLGWEAAWFAEIDPFCNAVLAHRYPSVPNLGDFTKIGSEHGAVDLLVGGTPCQDFSVAGERAGLAGDDGRLALEYVALLGRLRPRWVVWENVPGVLSSAEGRDFGAFLGALGQLGYGFAYRVLDAQHFGVPQRRRRVFVVGHLGDWRAPAAVLLERHGLSGHPPPRRPQGQGVASTLGRGSETGGVDATDFERAGAYVVGAGEEQVAHALTGSQQRLDGTVETLVLGLTENQRGELFLSPAVNGLSGGGGKPGQGYPAVLAFAAQGGTHSKAVGEDVAPSLKVGDGNAGYQTAIAFSYIDDGRDATADLVPTRRVGTSLKDGQSGGGIGGNAAVAWGFRHSASVADGNPVLENLSPALRAGDSQGQAVSTTTVRRLTPVECERLQGFPDGWTDVPYRGKRAPDGQRYRALGNSMAVPCMAWIGRRIALVERLLTERKEG